MSETTQLVQRPASLSEAVGSLDVQLERFRGRVDPGAVVLKYMREYTSGEENGGVLSSRGQTEFEQNVSEKIVQPIRNYLSLIIRIGEAMSDEIHKEFSSEQVRIAQVRADFDFRSWLVKIMFVIDAEIEEELRVSQMLNQLESIVLHSGSFAAELDYVNKRNESLDCDSLRRRYPFVAKVRPRT
jgi:hypothetical protein